MKRREFSKVALLGVGGAVWMSVPASVRGLTAASSGDQTSAPKAAGGELSVRVGETVEITCSFRRCWFPTIHQFANGDLMATMRMSPDECNPEGDFSGYCLSREPVRMSPCRLGDRQV